MIAGAARRALVGAAVAALAMTGVSLALGQAGGPAGVSVVADSPPLGDDCKGPANGWQGDGGGPSRECSE
ncbi:hypothetical protein [Streptomyces sp. NPDC050804]|uniref:hypothetical protein n=1 Tax=Streptomyces sp. NPDC050804 TaxID=3154745 RepID=UPI00343C0E6A